ncbi:MAG: HemK/PrmC family methyltransferase [Phycisphaerales bacterium]
MQDQEPWTTGRLRTWIKTHLEERGVESPAVCADMLLSAAIGAERLRLYMEPDRLASDEERATLRAWVKRASNHEPVQYLVGEAWFHQARIEVDSSTMIPRPATETLVEVGHQRLPTTSGSVRILDLCTGTGCVSIALLNLINRPYRAAARMHEAEAAARADLGRLSTALSSGGGPAAGGKAILEIEDEFEGEDEDQVEDQAEDQDEDQVEDQVEIQDSGAEDREDAAIQEALPAEINTEKFVQASVVATELVEAAAGLAQRNVARHLYADRIDVRIGSLYEPLTAEESSSFDLIVSNPPYISDAEFDLCPPNVRDHEPATALRGGKDGLEVIREVIDGAPAWLVPGGILAIEMQYDQASAVQSLFAAAGFEAIQLHQDVDELDRVVSGRHPGA